MLARYRVALACTTILVSGGMILGGVRGFA